MISCAVRELFEETGTLLARGSETLTAGQRASLLDDLDSQRMIMVCVSMLMTSPSSVVGLRHRLRRGGLTRGSLLRLVRLNSSRALPETQNLKAAIGFQRAKPVRSGSATKFSCRRRCCMR